MPKLVVASHSHGQRSKCRQVLDHSKNQRGQANENANPGQLGGVPFTNRGVEKSSVRKIPVSAPINSSAPSPEMAIFETPCCSQPAPSNKKGEPPRAIAAAARSDRRCRSLVVRFGLSSRFVRTFMQRLGDSRLGCWFVEEIHLRSVLQSRLFFNF